MTGQPHDQESDIDELLRELGSRVNASRIAFLGAIKRRSDRDASRQVKIEAYLRAFADNPELSKTARASANEAIYALRNFINTEVRTANQVHMAGLMMNVAVDHTLVMCIGAIAKAVGIANGADKAKRYVRERYQQLESAGNLVIGVQDLATALLDMHETTISTLLREKIEITWQDLVSKIKEVLKDDNNAANKQEAWKALLEIAGEMMDIALGEISILVRLPTLWEKIRKKFEVDVSAGGADNMQKFTELLRKEGEVLAKLNAAYEHAMDDIKKFGKMEIDDISLP